ncbi:DUF3465 domain-containing protein [Psychromonas sp. KJ10-10]|uniref:DUF3465 domain-containing protein n=1 Tax=Psychromonas sp. KJ10-10 TaxID=3391823 RepID=UPI0039B67063
MKKFLILMLIGVSFYQWATEQNNSATLIDHKVQSTTNNVNNISDSTIENAYRNKQSDVQVNGIGKVIKLLRDDNKGSRHQKFILRLSSGQTLLIAHNIDLAPRIDSLSTGDQVNFYGEYEWNNKGGVVHWTHKDPNGHHIDGWLKHNGRIYQ